MSVGAKVRLSAEHDRWLERNTRSVGKGDRSARLDQIVREHPLTRVPSSRDVVRLSRVVGSRDRIRRELHLSPEAVDKLRALQSRMHPGARLDPALTVEYVILCHRDRVDARPPAA
jgi:hypothetical protein